MARKVASNVEVVNIDEPAGLDVDVPSEQVVDQTAAWQPQDQMRQDQMRQDQQVVTMQAVV